MENDVGNFRIGTFSVTLPETWGIFLRSSPWKHDGVPGGKPVNMWGFLRLWTVRVSYSYPHRRHSPPLAVHSVPVQVFLIVCGFSIFCSRKYAGGDYLIHLSSQSWELQHALESFRRTSFKLYTFQSWNWKSSILFLSFLSRRGTSLMSICKWQGLLTWPQLTASSLGNVVLDWKSALVIICEEKYKP